MTVTLRNNLPAAAGNTSILFPGFAVTTTVGGPGVAGLLTQEAASGGIRHLYLHGDDAGHAYLLQRHAGRPADRDGPVRRPHRPADAQRWCADWLTHSPGPAAATCSAINAARHCPMGIPTSASRPPRTTTLRPATTASTCSSFRRSIPRSTAGAEADSGLRRGPRRDLSDQHEYGRHRAVRAGVLHGQRPVDAGPDGPELHDAVPASAVQRQSAHAPRRARVAANHRHRPLAAPVPRARQSRSRAGARRQPAADRDRPTGSPVRCSSRRRRRQARRSTASSSGPARA